MCLTVSGNGHRDGQRNVTSARLQLLNCISIHKAHLWKRTLLWKTVVAGQIIVVYEAAPQAIPHWPCDWAFTLSMCGCQYSSCRVLAAVPLILEKNVGLVRYIEVGSKPNVLAIIAWILPRTSLYRARKKTKQTWHVKGKYLIQLPEEYD